MKTDTKDARGEFFSLARKNNYPESMIMFIGTICSSPQIHENGYSTIEAFAIAKKFVEKGKTASETVIELMKISNVIE